MVDGIPYCTSKYDEIIPNLFMGGLLYRRDDVVTFSVPNRKFDLVINLEKSVPPIFHHLYPMHTISFPILDGELDDNEWVAISEAVKIGLTFYEDGKNSVLSRCLGGFNRSGLIIGLMLRELGYDDPVQLIREKRSPNALHNLYFVRYIRNRVLVKHL